MIHFHFGTDWYGAVKHVGASQVVTEFFHINSFPLYPRHSAVICRSDEAGSPWQVVPLATKDWQSVMVAYVRGIAGGLIVLGSIPLIFGFIFWLLDDGQTDIPPTVIMSVGGIAIAAGALLGAPSYLLWRYPNSRESVIRQIANIHLNAAADPALIDRNLAREWAMNIELTLLECGILDFLSALERAHEHPQFVRQLMLLRLRCDSQYSERGPVYEGRIDRLLKDIAVPERSPEVVK